MEKWGVKTSFSWLRNRWVLRITSLVIFLILWELIGPAVNPVMISSPTRIAGALYEVTVSGELIKNLLATLETTAFGFVLAAVLGIPLGVAMGRWRSVEYLTDPYTTALSALPRAALIPVIIIWVGLGLMSRVVVVFLFAYFPIVINTYAGFKNVSYELIETGRSFGANERQLFSKIILPASTPFIMAGLRLGLIFALKGAVIAEMLLVLTGIGGMIEKYFGVFWMPHVWAIVIALALMGIVLWEGIKYAENKLLPWKT